MALPLMPKATAVWLVENSMLTFDQIAEFCGLHSLEVQSIADEEVDTGMRGADPIANGQLTQEAIDQCSADSNARLKLSTSDILLSNAKPKKGRYTPISKRQDRPDAIAWLLKNHPELSDPQISKLIRTTKPTITAIRERTHWNTSNIKPQNPVSLGLCPHADMEKQIAIARARAGTVHASAKDVEALDTGGITLVSAEEGAESAPQEPVFEVEQEAPENADKDKDEEKILEGHDLAKDVFSS